MHIDENYHNLLKKILDEGYDYEDPNRKGVMRKELASYTFKHSFSDGFPAITLKKLAWKSVVTELIWFLRGDTNIKYLIDNGCNIWNKDAYNYYLKVIKINSEWYKNEKLSFDEFINAIKSNKFKDVWWKNKPYYQLGDLGKVYGHYWRDFNGIDQIKELIHDMINKPMSSELLVVARDPSHKKAQALPCCHYGFQIVMRPINNEIGINPQQWNLTTGEIKNLPKYGFELHFKMRSVDTFLGLPFNIASYALLALILEKITGHKALGIQGDLKKVHLYDNSLDGTKEQLSRCINKYTNCTLEIKDIGWNEDLNDIIEHLMISDFKLKDYNPQPAIRVPMLARTV